MNLEGEYRLVEKIGFTVRVLARGKTLGALFASMMLEANAGKLAAVSDNAVLEWYDSTGFVKEISTFDDKHTFI